jgi:TonB-linked SusC/RagA family outer membrane protein
MMKRTFMLLCILLLSMLQLYAQTRVTGKVTDATDGSAVPFASVMVKGTTIGVSTDANGLYVINNVPANGILVFSNIGYQTQELSVNNRSVIDVVLAQQAVGLDQVLVVAYGTATKGSYSGSATQLRQENFKDVPVINFEQAIVGSVPGVQISQKSGQPGSLPEIRIRGFGSFNAGNEPLYVIDGVPATSGDWGSGNMYTSAMNFLNPGDIESITVLKDAAAASLYGSRASNGVIIITTKKGRAGKVTTTFKANMALSYFAMDNYPTVTEAEGEILTREAWTNYGNDNPAQWQSYGSLDNYVNVMTERYYPSRKSDLEYADWEKQLFRTAVSQNYEMSISGGNENSRVFASVAYTDDNGINRIQYLERFTANINAEHKMSNRLRVGGSIQFSDQKQSGHQDGQAKDNLFYLWKVHLTPRWPFKYDDGSYWMEFYDGGTRVNPVPQFDLQINDATQMRVMLKGWAELRISDDFKIKSLVSKDYLKMHDRFAWLYGHINFTAYGQGYASDRHRFVDRQVSSTIANYNKSLDKHNIALMAGWEAEREEFLYTRLAKIDFSNFGATESALATNFESGYTYRSLSNLLSFVSSASYDYDSRYYLSGSFRRDGSSRLGPDTRWGNFWSVAGSWRLSNEQFIKNINWINDLRIRGSYGTSGTLPSSYFGYMATFDYEIYGEEAAGYPSNLANKDLTWEKNRNWNIAVDARLWDKYEFVAEYYNKTTEDLLLNATVPSTTGFGSALTNIGSMENKGVELSLNVDIIKNKDMSLKAGINWATLKNKVLSLSEEGEQIVSRPHIWKAGYSYVQYYTREYYGVDPQTGNPLYYSNATLPDGSRDRTLVSRSQASSTILDGMTAIPKGFGGFNAAFDWKNFSASMSWSYKYGHHVWDNAVDDLEDDGYNSYKNTSARQLDRWQKPGDVTDVPRRVAGNNQGGYYDSSRALKKGDYLRWKNLTVSYSIPSLWLDKAGISNARVYMAGNNLLTFTGLNFDPEVQSNGYYNFTFPALRTFTLGLEISL